MRPDLRTLDSTRFTQPRTSVQALPTGFDESQLKAAVGISMEEHTGDTNDLRRYGRTCLGESFVWACRVLGDYPDASPVVHDIVC